MPCHDFIVVLRLLFILCILATAVFITSVLVTWIILLSGSGGRLQHDILAFMKRHGRKKIPFLLLLAGLSLDGGLQAVLLYRIGTMLYRTGLVLPAMLLQYISRRCTGADISIRSDIGEGLEIFHASGLCIGRDVKIGKNAWLFQNVTVGSSGKGSPKIGDNVKIFAGAVVVGDIVVENDVIVGANAVVLSDVPFGCMIHSPESERRCNPRETEL